MSVANTNTITLNTELVKFRNSDIDVDILFINKNNKQNAYLRVGDWCYPIRCYDYSYFELPFELKGSICDFLRIGTMTLPWHNNKVPEENRIIHIRNIACVDNTYVFTLAGLVIKAIYHISDKDYFMKYILEQDITSFTRLFTYSIRVNNFDGKMIAVDEFAGEFGGGTCTLFGTPYSDLARDLIFSR